MGALGDGKEAMAEAIAQGEQVITDGKTQAVQGIMDGLSGTLAEPTFEGDVETALIHHMGEGAFYDDEVTSRYTGLAERIEEEAAKDPEHGVPVLIVYKEHPDATGRKTVFIRVPEGDVRFRSEEEREEGVRMHAFTGSMVKNEETGEKEWQPTTATVTHKRLSIVASASTFSGDLLEPNAPVRADEEAIHGFTLSESHVADGGYGSGVPSDYAYNNYSRDRLGGDVEDMVDEDPTILVGWEEIENALMDRLSAGGKPSIDEAERLNEFFRVIAGISGFEAKVPRVAEVMNAAGQFRASINS